MLWNDKRPGAGLTEHSTGEPHGWNSVPKSAPSALDQRLNSAEKARGQARDRAANQGASHAPVYGAGYTAASRQHYGAR